MLCSLLGLVSSAGWLASCAPAPRPALSIAEYNQRAAPPDGFLHAGHPAPPGVEDKTASVRAAPVVVTAAADEGSTEPGAVIAASVPRNLPRLEAFYSALDELAGGTRNAPVRILWLGDSHTAADFMTHPIRQHLGHAFRGGGPGFVRLGLSAYRHGAVKFQVTGPVRKAPLLPAQQTRVLDGVFGYGGIRTLPASGSSVSASFREPSDDPVTWTLSYRLAPGDKLQVTLGDTAQVLSFDSTKHKEDGIEMARFSGRARDTFSISHAGGDPQVFGAFAEFDSPGVVLDTVGINGARLGTALAWEPTQYRAAIAGRKLDLVVLAFGTNEIFDKASVDRYQVQFENYLELVREVSPEVPCWIVGPPDAATSDGRSRERVALVTKVQRSAAEAMGCAFTSQYELMGGEGSFGRWMSERPSKARSDHIHFTISGYEELGKLLAEQLLPPDSDAEQQGPIPHHPAPPGFDEDAGDPGPGDVASLPRASADVSPRQSDLGRGGFAASQR